MVRHVILITFIQLCLIAISSAQFSVSTSRTTVPEGESFTIQFTLEGERGTQFRAPSFKDFKVISGPNMASQYSNNNGRVSMFSSYSYEILATSQGVFTIGPASIRSGNNQYTTESINIKVTEPKPTSKATIDGESDFFARL